MTYLYLIIAGAILLFIFSSITSFNLFLERIRQDTAKENYIKYIYARIFDSSDIELLKIRYTEKNEKRIAIDIYKSAFSINNGFLVILFLIVTSIAFAIYYSILSCLIQTKIPRLFEWENVIYPFIGLIITGQILSLIFSANDHFIDIKSEIVHVKTDDLLKLKADTFENLSYYNN